MKFFKNLVLGLFFVVTLSAANATTVTLPEVICNLQWKEWNEFWPNPYATNTPAPASTPAPAPITNEIILPAMLGDYAYRSEPEEGETSRYIINVQGLRGPYIPVPHPMVPWCGGLSVDRFSPASDGKLRGVRLLIRGEPSMDEHQLVVIIDVVNRWKGDYSTSGREWIFVTQYNTPPIPPEPMGTWGSPVDEGIQWMGLWNIFDGHIQKSPQPVGSDCNVGDSTPNEWIYESAPYQDENGNVIPERGAAVKIPKAVCAEHGFGNYAFCYRAHQLKQTCNK